MKFGLPNPNWDFKIDPLPDVPTSSPLDQLRGFDSVVAKALQGSDNPHDQADFLAGHGYMVLQKGQVAEAKRSYETAVGLLKGDIAAQTRLLTRAGNHFYDQGAYQEAKHFRQMKAQLWR